MQTPIKVLMLIDQLFGGGAQEYLYQLVKNLDRTEVEFVVVTLRSGGYYLKKLEDANIRVIALSHRTNLLTIPIQLFRLLSLARKEKFDLCHSFLEGAFVISLFLSFGLRIPLLHSVLAYRFQARRWYYPLMALSWPLVNCYVTFYDPDKFEQLGIPKDRIQRIEVAIDVSRPQADRVALADNSSLGITGNPLVVSVGRLHPHKGHEYAIRAWKSVIRELPDARLAIVGEGDDEGRLKRLVSIMGLEDTIVFTGYLQYLESFFKRATIYVRTSLNEGVNLTTMLAMRVGVPTIGFRNPDVKEIINDGVSGLLVPYKDEVGLADGIIRLSKDTDLQQRLSDAARTTVQQYHNLAETVENYKKLYHAIVPSAKQDM
jgi:glycosyltransferase involved in cell wall biosynthesis